jgi:hypothetical protein
LFISNGLTETVTGDKNLLVALDQDANTLHLNDTGNDTVLMGDGNDVVTLGGGHDLLVGGVGFDHFTEGAGAHQTIVAGANTIQSFGGSGVGDIVEGGTAIQGGSGDNQTLVGLAGQSTVLTTGTGAVQKIIAAGTDTVNVNDEQGTITVDGTNAGVTLHFAAQTSTNVASEHTNATTGVVTLTFDSGQVVKVAGVAQATFADGVTQALPVTAAELVAGQATAAHEAAQVEANIVGILADHHV